MAFFTGLIVGALISVIFMSMFIAAKDADTCSEAMLNKYEQSNSDE